MWQGVQYKKSYTVLKTPTVTRKIAENLLCPSLGCDIQACFFCFFFVFQEKIKFSIFLSIWPSSLFVAKTCLSDRIFPQIFVACGGLTKFEKNCHSDHFFACGGLINLRIRLRNFFSDSFLSEKSNPEM
jgi:hypothetical protein